MIGFRMKMIAAGYEDGNDANRLRADPVFKMAQDALHRVVIWPHSRRSVAGEPPRRSPTDRHGAGDGRSRLRLVPAGAEAIVLDIDDTFDAVHGGQQFRLFNAHYDVYGFQPIVVFDGEGRFVGTVLRPAKRPGGVEIRGHLRRLVRAIRATGRAPGS